MVNLGKYTSPMDPVGYETITDLAVHLVHFQVARVRTTKRITNHLSKEILKTQKNIIDHHRILHPQKENSNSGFAIIT